MSSMRRKMILGGWAAGAAGTRREAAQSPTAIRNLKVEFFISVALQAISGEQPVADIPQAWQVALYESRPGCAGGWNVRLRCESARGLAQSKTWRRALAFFTLTSAFCLCASAQDYTNRWSTVDGGGRSSTGGVYTITGTVGQPDASRRKMSGGEYTVNGGFWGRIAVVQMPGAPRLTIRQTGVNTLAICWPYPSTGYGLERSSGLELLNWTPVPGLPVHVGDEWQVTVTPSTEIRCDPYGDPINYCDSFRLKKAEP
jgi:hypothetical protein